MPIFPTWWLPPLKESDAGPRFFDRQGPFPLSELAACGEAELDGSAEPAKLIRDVAPLDGAGPDDIAFLDNPKYLDAFTDSAAGACIINPSYRGRAPPA